MQTNGSTWRVDGADAALALGMLAFGLVGTGGALANTNANVEPTEGYVLVALAALALAVRRRLPYLTLAVTTGAVTGYLMLGYPYGPILVVFFVAVYTVAAYRPLRQGATACAVAGVAMAAPIGVAGWAGVMPAVAWVAVPFAVGTTVRLVRESTSRARAAEARRLADDERLRVAREVHDVVGHGLAAIHLQAEIALHLLARKPEQAEAALTAISRTSKAALDELRVTLTVLRRDEPTEERAPAPGLAQLPELRSRLAGAGVPLTVEVTGEPRPIPVAVDLAAYRVAQESLTNVLRHAGPATATVRLRYVPDAVVVEVADTGHGPSGAGGSGYGLAGMRERVTALGGTFSAGPGADGGFRVYAELPTEGTG